MYQRKCHSQERNCKNRKKKEEKNLARILKKVNVWKKLEMKKENPGKKSSRKKTSVEDKLCTEGSTIPARPSRN